jgi:predicted Zn-dependent protease
LARSLQIANDTQTRQLRAKTLVRLKRYDEAERQFVALLEPPGQSGVDDAGVVDGLAQVWMERDHDVARALGMCRDARGQLPASCAAITVRIAAILITAGRLDEATTELENAREAATRERSAMAPMVFLRLGKLYLDQGRQKDARGALAEFLRLTEGVSDAGIVDDRRSATEAIRTIDRGG